MRKFIPILFNLLLIPFFLCLAGCGTSDKTKETITPPTGKTLLEYGGRASTKLITKEGLVIYIDPYVGDYSEKADLVLITHEHEDHNALHLVPLNQDNVIIRAKDVLENGNYKTLNIKGVNIEAVAAYNQNHLKSACVGYILTIDGVKIYHAGDTSMIDEMKLLKDKKIDYALLPYDGQFNMGPAEMSQVAKLINAKHIIPIHGISQDPTSIKLDNLITLKEKDRIELIK